MMSLEDGEQTTEVEQVERVKTLSLKLVDLKSYRLGGGPNAREANNEEFFRFASSVVGLGERWSVEQRRDFLNWALREGLLEVEDGTNVLEVKKNSTPKTEVHAQDQKTDVL